MQLVIAEKPSVARDLARVLGVRGAGKHAIADGQRTITWCIGHLVELEEPAAYDGRWKAWRLDALPMIPQAFKLRPVEGTRQHLHAVSGLLRDRRFTEVVNACDAGREGELIFRYVYELAGCRLPVRRLWISSMTDEAIGRGFAALKAGREYDALADAARCRSEADWLVGMNATRAVTVARRSEAPARPAPARKPGRGTERGLLYSIGRVQTPTLAIVVARERAIASFRPQDYWEVRGRFATGGAGGATFTAGWSTPSPKGKGSASRLGAQALAAELVARTTAHGAATDPLGPVVERVKGTKSREPPPQLFDLTTLQRTANRRWGISATRTLEAAQALYERHKLLTYPRTDSRHLSSDLAGELPKLFRGLAGIPDYHGFAETLLGAPPARPKRVFDDGKVHDHHAIIPTGKAARLEALAEDERRIFDLVARRFLGAFFPDAEFALTDVVIRVGPGADERAPRKAEAPPSPVEPAADEAMLAALPPPPDRFHARGRVRLVAGWQEVAQLGGTTGAGRGASKEATDKQGDAEGEGEATLPALAEGQRLDGAFESVARQTKPPPRHTEATLLGAMEYAGRDIADEALRAAMKDTGLGTPATRAATIETLVKRGFVARQGKQIVATPTGITLIEGLPVASLASPELTGAWEARLARVARGQEARSAFMSDIVRYVGDVVTAIRSGSPPANAAAAKALPTNAPPAKAPPATTTPKTARTSDSAERAVSKSAAKAPSANALASRADAAALLGPEGARAAKTVAAGEVAAPPLPAAPPLICPRCKQAPLVTGRRGWGCARWREGCSFVIWFETAGRRLTAAQLRELIAKGKTRKATWSPSGNPDERLPGRLVLDAAAGPPTGSARFEPG